MKFKINKFNINIKNGLLFTLFSFLNNGVNFFLIMILAKYLSPEGYGYLNLFNTLIIVATVFISLGCTSYIANSFFRKKRRDFKKIITIILYIGLVSFLLITILIFLLGSILEQYIGLTPKFQFYAFFICFFQLFTTINLEIWRIQEKPIKYGLYSMSVVVLNFSLTIFFVVIVKMEWEGRVISQLIVSAIFCLISLIFLYKRKLLVLKKIEIPLIKETLLFGLPLIPHLISSWMRQGMDKYIINSFWDVNFVGLFSFSLNIGNIIHMVGTAFNASYAVSTYKALSNIEEKTQYNLKKQITFMSLFFITLAAFVYIGAYLIIPVWLPKYIDCRSCLFPICLSATFQCIYYLFVNFLFYYKKTKILMYTTSSISILHVLLSFIFTRYGIIYTAYISLFSNFVVCLLICIYSQKYYPIFRKK